MDKVSTESVRNALDVFLKLIDKSTISKSEYPELFETLEDEETEFVLRLIEEQTDILVIRSGDSIYFSPGTENTLFGYKNEDLRREMHLDTNLELYTAYVIMLSIIIKFYSGENYNSKCRTILKIEELEEFITTKMAAASTDEYPEERDEELSFNFTNVAQNWLGMPSYDEKIVAYSRSKGTRVSLIHKVLAFLKEQGLVNVDNDTEIFTTAKFDTIVKGYYPESSRKRLILSYLDKLEKHERPSSPVDSNMTDSNKEGQV